jgi:hypothetical protein
MPPFEPESYREANPGKAFPSYDRVAATMVRSGQRPTTLVPLCSPKGRSRFGWQWYDCALPMAICPACLSAMPEGPDRICVHCRAAGYTRDLEEAVSPEVVGQLPNELREFIGEIEQWAKANAKDARKDKFSFWTLKIPAILSSAFASFLAAVHLNIWASLLAAMASACILIDAAFPRGQLFRAHLRAVHDLRNIQHEIMNRWRAASFDDKNKNRLAADILKMAEQTRSRIARELRTAETAMGHSPGKK